MPSITKPCHNCRRRRLRCDRSWPSCHKCAVSGQECLGYGKVFVWTQAIDAHGNVKPSPGRQAAGGSLDHGGESRYPPPPLATASSASSSSIFARLSDGSAVPATDTTGAAPGTAGGDIGTLATSAPPPAPLSLLLPHAAGAGHFSFSPFATPPLPFLAASGGASATPPFAYSPGWLQEADEANDAQHAPDHRLGGGNHGNAASFAGHPDTAGLGYFDQRHYRQQRHHGQATSAASTAVATPTLAGTAAATTPGDYDGASHSSSSSSSTPHPPDDSHPGLPYRPDPRQREPNPIHGRLTDPVFQDLDRNSRYYLAHFADRVCKDLVARDAPGRNPFRELIPLTNNHPLLLQVLIATSALHWSNIFRPITAIPAGLSDPGGYLALLRSKDLVSRSALIDALTAKQKAMGHLRDVLDTLDPAGSEVTLAAMHFFIKFDLIDLEKSDGKSWKAHLEGASNILALLRPEGVNTASSRMLRDCILADCFIYHILGSTLASGGIASSIAKYAIELLPVMKRVEVNSYLSCPPEILQIILSASKLSYESPRTDWSLSSADDALALIDEALAFDIPAWADQLQRVSNVGDVESRVHIASAHRSAACLYILQALPLIRSVRPVDTDFVLDDILGHLAQIGEDDPYFKATSWPTFIAGAETRDAEKRTWCLTRLLKIWEIIPWGYIFTAIEMLKATWQMQDARGNQGDAGINWLQDLKGMGFDFLIV